MKHISTLIFGLLLFLPHHTKAADTIKIGDFCAYTKYALHCNAYKKGVELAIEEINTSGGVIGKTLKLVSRDSFGTPDKALRVVEELINRDNVDFLTGGYLTHVAVAVAALAERYQKPYFAIGASPNITWTKKRDHVYKVNLSEYAFAGMLAEKAAEFDLERWATIGNNYEFGHAIVDAFQENLNNRQDDVIWATEQWPTIGKIDAAAEIQALRASKPDAILVALVGKDLISFARELKRRDAFQDTPIFAYNMGYPEIMPSFGSDYPEGWISDGYPVEQLDTQEQKKFKRDYVDTFGELPKRSSLIGYITIHAMAKGIEKAGSTDPNAFSKHIAQIEVLTPDGLVSFRDIDHQSSWGHYIGTTKLVDGKPKFVEWDYKNTHDYLPSNEYIHSLRLK